MSSSNPGVSNINIRVHLSAGTQAYLQPTLGVVEVYVLGVRGNIISNSLPLYRMSHIHILICMPVNGLNRYIRCYLGKNTDCAYKQYMALQAMGKYNLII